MMKLMSLPGYDRLARDVQLAISDDRTNMIAISKNVNSSRQEKTFAEWFARGGHRQANKHGWTMAEDAEERLVQQERTAMAWAQAEIGRRLALQKG